MELKILDSSSKELQIATKLRKCNDVIRNLFKEDFDKEMSKYKHFINACMEKHKIDNQIEAAMKLIEDAKDMSGADMFAVKIFSACVELMEGR